MKINNLVTGFINNFVHKGINGIQKEEDVKNNLKEKEDLSFFASNLSFGEDLNCLNNTLMPLSSNLVRAENEESEDFLDTSVYYISDIHLDSKLIKEFPEGGSEKEIVDRIKKYVIEMVGDKDAGKYLLILGDVSYNFEISKTFYSELAKLWTRGRILAVIGNHELWDMHEKKVENPDKKDFDIVISKYSRFFEEHNIVFLNNGIFLSQYPNGFNLDIEQGYSRRNNGKPFNRYIYGELLLGLSKEDVQEYLKGYPLIIFGGTGYAKYNEKYNADAKIYSTKLIREDEIKLTNEFERIYQILRGTIDDKKVIVATHMPKSDWSRTDCIPGWIYVNGHTHKNEYVISDDRTVYSDNQIGYHETNFSLKYFNLNYPHGTFKHFPDGIHEISANDYKGFYRAQKSRINFNRSDGKVFMLKRHGYYLFIYQKENPKGTKLFILNGGSIKKLENNNLSYYFEYMVYYADALKHVFKDYNDALHQLSSAVKEIGGSGKIHGCIIDIDYLSHLYLNPYDGTLTPYYATSVTDKYIYPSLEEMLRDYNPKMLKVLKKKAKRNKNLSLLKEKYPRKAKVDKIEFLSDTSIYSSSLRMKRIQYATHSNIIREWNDGIIKYGMSIAGINKSDSNRRSLE